MRVHANLGQHLTLLGICALVFTLFMVALGKFPPSVLPQFLASGIIFLVAGRQLRTDRESEQDTARTAPVRRRLGYDADWPWLTKLLHWTCALLLISCLALALVKPAGVSFSQGLQYTRAHEHFFAGAVP